AAISEYERAEVLDKNVAIADYNHSVAAGSDNKFDVQAQKLDQAKRIDRASIERISSNPPPQLVVMYRPPLPEAWAVATSVARRGVARALFGSWAWFDPLVSARNPVTAGGLLAFVLAPLLWLKRRRAGSGLIGNFAFLFFVLLALLVGRLAPVLAPGDVAKLIVRAVAIFLAVVIWLVMDLPVFRRKAAV